MPQRTRRSTALLLAALLGLAACDGADPEASNAALTADALTSLAGGDDPRMFRPVVLSAHEGHAVDRLLGTAVGAVVAFAYDAGGDAFRQIPVQVDERARVPLMKVYRGIQSCYGGWCLYENSPILRLGYTDADGFAGPDVNPLFDADDEIALLLSDFGAPAQGHPAGVVEGTATEVVVQFNGVPYYAYLYRRSNPDLDPAAGRNHVTYHFETVNPVYDVVGRRVQDFQRRLTPDDHGVSNPEVSWVEADGYRVQFADRWIMDYLAVGPPGERSPDLLTIDMLRFTDDPGREIYTGCQRWSFTGSVSEGGFLVNRDGPIRAIRHAVGFNSGPTVGLTWLFYPHGYEADVVLRLHNTPHGLALFYHMAEAAEGYTYGYGTGTGTTATDVVDEASPGFGLADLPAWQTMTAPGTGAGWATTFDVRSDIPFYEPDEQPRLFYEDDGASDENCDIDDVSGNDYQEALTFYRGAHGVEIPLQTAWGPGTQLEVSGLPNTDERHLDHDTSMFNLAVRRTYAFGPEPAVALAALQAPFAVQAQPYTP